MQYLDGGIVYGSLIKMFDGQTFEMVDKQRAEITNGQDAFYSDGNIPNNWRVDYDNGNLSVQNLQSILGIILNEFLDCGIPPDNDLFGSEYFESYLPDKIKQKLHYSTFLPKTEAIVYRGFPNDRKWPYGSDEEVSGNPNWDWKWLGECCESPGGCPIEVNVDHKPHLLLAPNYAPSTACQCNGPCYTAEQCYGSPDCDCCVGNTCTQAQYEACGDCQPQIGQVGGGSSPAYNPPCGTPGNIVCDELFSNTCISQLTFRYSTNTIIKNVKITINNEELCVPILCGSDCSDYEAC